MTVAVGPGCGSVTATPDAALDTNGGPDGAALDAATDAAIDAAVPTCAAVPSYLRARYRADGNALDDGGAYDGTPYSTSYGTGRFGSAFVFTGDEANSYLTIDDGDALWPSGAISLEAWVKAAAPNALGPSVIVTKTACGGQCDISRDTALFSLYLDDVGRPMTNFRGDNSSTFMLVGGPTAITDGAWHHLVGVRDPSALKVSLYVDGALVAESSGTNALFGAMSNLDAEVDLIRVGAGLPGSIDELAIYHSALSAAQVLELYSAPEGKCP